MFQDMLAEHGVIISHDTVWRFLRNRLFRFLICHYAFPGFLDI